MLHSYHVLRFLAVVLCVAGVCGTQAFAADPQVSVRAEDSWWADLPGDSFSNVPTLWDRGYMLWYDVLSGTVAGASAQINLPAGLDEIWAEIWGGGASYLHWNVPTSAAKWTAVGNLGGQMMAGVDAVPTYATETPPLVGARSISAPVLTENIQTRTLTFDLTVTSSLSEYNWLNVNLLTPWNTPDDITYSVTSSSAPAGFSAGSDPGTFQCDDLSALAFNTPYSFTAEVQITRSGPLTKDQMGDLYHKPSSSVNYGFWTDAPSVTGTSMTMNLAPGVDAKFGSAATVDFSGGSSVAKNLFLGGVVAGVGEATPTSISVNRGKRTSLSGTDIHQFSVEIEGSNIVAGTVTTPGSAVYALAFDDESWDFGRGSATASDLDEFVSGTYHITLTGSDGLDRNFTVELPAKDLPTDSPAFDQPMGFETTNVRPTLSWQASADPDANKTYFEVFGVCDGQWDFGELFDNTVTSFTPTEDLPLGGYIGSVFYGDHSEGTTTEGAPLQISFYNGLDSYFNVVPEPATLSLLALGGLAVLRRRRR